MNRHFFLFLYLLLPIIRAQTTFYCSEQCAFDPKTHTPVISGPNCTYTCPSGSGTMQMPCPVTTTTPTTTALAVTTPASSTSNYFCSDTCVLDIGVATFDNNGTHCNYACSGGGTMSTKCTTTTTTTTEPTTTEPTTSAASSATKYLCSDTCVVDIATASYSVFNGTHCTYECGGTGGGEMTVPCTATNVTAATTTTTVAPSGGGGTCGPIVKDDGQQYDNKCVIVDPAATCDETAAKLCTCSAGYSGTNCQIPDDQLALLEQLMGNTTDAKAQAQKMLELIYSSKGHGGPATLIANLPALLSFLTDEERIGMSYDASEVIIGATYEGQTLDQYTDFVRVNDPSLGNCFTFNHHNASLKYNIRRIGVEGGLRVELDSLPNEYAPWTDVVGMNVYVHPVGLELNVESSKYSSIAGSADQLVISRSVFHKIKKRCARDTNAAQSFYLPGDYSVDGCLRACYQDSVLRSCGCMDASYARKPGVAGCKFGKLTCIAEMVAKRGDPVHWSECRCPQPCDEQQYDYVVSRATNLRIDNANYTNRRSEVILFFDSFQTRLSQEEYKMTLSQVAGYVGGVAGLLLGINFTFIIDIALLLVTLCFCSKPPKPDEHKTA